MRVDPIFQRTFSELYGKAAWGVKPGFGSFITLEFGRPHLEIREPISPKSAVSKKLRDVLARRQIVVRGDWHLWIYCCKWQVFSGGRRIGFSESRDIQR